MQNAARPDAPGTALGLAIVVCHGDVPRRSALDSAWPGWADGPRLVIAADGGAAAAEALGLPVDVLVGDLDSIADDRLLALEAGGVPIEAWPAEKDATDAELALRAALRHEPERIVVLGATGGDRLDHALANVALLGHADLAGRDVALLDGSSRTRLLRGPGEAVLSGRAGDLVSLIPIGEAAHMVTTSGLAYPLTGEGLAAGTSRGISNVRLATTAGVRLERGRLLIIETTSS